MFKATPLSFIFVTEKYSVQVCNKYRQYTFVTTFLFEWGEGKRVALEFPSEAP